ncbi:MAG TPA: hypothetical protein PLN52_08970 [Opitutaceae bacterium]|nr:hypothetical protein [Opitutaceae bacterium]
MKDEEIHFILAAHRPNGGDAADPMMAAALARVKSDATLRQWFAREQALDLAVARKMSEVNPPADLKALILAGGRVTDGLRGRTQKKRNFWLVGLAAAIAMAAGLTWGSLRIASAGKNEFAELAVNDLKTAHDQHVAFPLTLGPIQAMLSGTELPLPRSLRLNLDDLRERRCRTLIHKGRLVFEVCFFRNGNWFHLYIGRQTDFPTSPVTSGIQLISETQQAAATWTHGELVYTLVTEAGVEALRKLI